MAAVDGAKISECLFPAQLAEQNAVGPKPQRGFAKVLRRHARQALLAARVEQAHHVLLGRAKLARVLDDHQALATGNLF